MPIVFEEISGEIEPPQGTEAPQSTTQPTPQDGADPTERLRYEIRLMRERESRLITD